MAIKLPPNDLDKECLRGGDEDYFIKRMKKLKSDRLEEGWYSNSRSRPRRYQDNDDNEELA